MSALLFALFHFALEALRTSSSDPTRSAAGRRAVTEDDVGVFLNSGTGAQPAAVIELVSTGNSDIGECPSSAQTSTSLALDCKCGYAGSLQRSFCARFRPMQKCHSTWQHPLMYSAIPTCCRE